jgi:hypothetical protein
LIAASGAEARVKRRGFLETTPRAARQATGLEAAAKRCALAFLFWRKLGPGLLERCGQAFATFEHLADEGDG